ncbi:MAG: SDR family oxidoreductase [Actinomycetia bacterium]|nr:SDR family oxidoreductase [Actinomycetes bacterium]
MRLENKVALVTGGGSGIGAATARLFAAEGAKIVVTGRRPAPLAAVAEEVGGLAVPGDTGDPTHIAEGVAAAVSRFGGVDVLVTSAGIAPGGTVGDIEDDDWESTLRTNLNGPMMMSRAVLPLLLARGRGSIVLVSSTAGLAAAPASAAYDVSKAGLIALARAIAVDYGNRGIRANALVPGWVKTPMGDRSMDALGAARNITRQQAYDRATADVPLRRAGTPEEMAACCLFLASDESRYVSGTTLVADGGGLAVELTSTEFTFGGQSA